MPKETRFKLDVSLNIVKEEREVKAEVETNVKAS